MPFLWFAEVGRWAVMPLADTAVSLGEEGDARGLPIGLPTPPAGRGPILVRVNAAGAKWVLLSPRDWAVRVNGERPPGIRILEHGDDIRIGSRQLFFSAEQRARAEPLPGTDAAVSCGRCTEPIVGGSPAVRCPNCGVWHHASQERGCWTYAPGCSACEHDTNLDAEFRWTPEQM